MLWFHVVSIPRTVCVEIRTHLSLFFLHVFHDGGSDRVG